MDYVTPNNEDEKTEKQNECISKFITFLAIRPKKNDEICVLKTCSDFEMKLPLK